MEHNLKQALRVQRSQQLYRSRQVLDSPQSTRVSVDGRELLSFCSNDYLGLANHPDVIKAFKLASDQYGVGAGASHLVTGHLTPHHELEIALAKFTQRDRALVFSSGFLANMGVIASLLGKNDAVFQDKLNHASLLDAGLLSGAKFRRFLHNDLDSLQRLLDKNTSAQQTLVVVDAVFSMDGDMAPIADMVDLVQDYDACLMVDDAHGFGVFGEQGAGSLQHLALTQTDVPILMGTLGKAFGTAGAFVAGSETLIETLIQRARSYIYTTALPPAIAAATLTSLEIVKTQPQRRKKLHELIAYFKVASKKLGLQLIESDSAIQPIVLGSAERALDVSEKLKQQGVLISAIRPPTVPAGTSRLRITLCADHCMGDVDQLLAALGRVLK